MRPTATLLMVTIVQDLLLAYDEQLRTEAEIAGAIKVTCLGQLLLVTFDDGRAFVTYPFLAGIDAEALRERVEQALDHFRQHPEIAEVEWKTRGHDRAPGLHEALVDNGFAPGEPEAIMIGRAEMLDVGVQVPDGVTLRRVTDENDVRAMAAMQEAVFQNRDSEDMTRGLLRRLALKDGMELWVAEAQGQIVCTGRLEPIDGTEFAGIWGGATHEDWRGQGIYRALTAARARSALAKGKTLIHSDSTEYSRPILERSGFLKVSTTTPYHWTR